MSNGSSCFDVMVNAVWIFKWKSYDAMKHVHVYTRV